MKILYIISALNNKAPNKLALILANYMAEHGYSVSVAFFDNDISISLNNNIKYIKVSFFDDFVISNYDVVHSHMLRADVYTFSKAINNRVRNTKIISTFHCYFYKELINYHNKIFSFIIASLWILIARRFDIIVTLTDHMKKYYHSFGFTNVVKIYNGIDIEDSTPTTDVISSFIDINSITIGTYCNLIPRKNIEVLIDLVEKHDNFKLIIIGDGPHFNTLFNLVVEKNLCSKILLTGYLEKPYIYNKFFDIFAIPSKDEAFGLALVEAALCRQNIVCSDIPAFKEIFDESSVCFFDPDSTSSLYNAINEVLSSTQYKFNCYKIASVSFSSFAMCINYEKLYLS